MNQHFIGRFEYGKPIGPYYKQDGGGVFYMNIGGLF